MALLGLAGLARVRLLLKLSQTFLHTAGGSRFALMRCIFDAHQ